MPKFYCDSGDFREVFDAKDIHECIKKSENKLRNGDKYMSPIVVISEKGFGCIDDDTIVVENNVYHELGKEMEEFEQFIGQCCGDDEDECEDGECDFEEVDDE